MMHWSAALSLALIVVVSSALIVRPAPAQQGPTSGVSSLEQRVGALERRIGSVEQEAAAGGIVLILFGAFCALWAQNTGRSAWGWFFLGVFFSVITVLVLLYKNSEDIDGREGTP